MVRFFLVTHSAIYGDAGLAKGSAVGFLDEGIDLDPDKREDRSQQH